MMNHIDRYLARLILTPLMATLAISALLLLLDKMLKLFDFVINEGGPVTVVWRMLGNLIPQYLGLGIPIGLMLGVILTFRKLALSSELDAIIGSGVSHLRLLRVPLLYSATLAILTLWIVGFLQPYTRYAYEGLRFELRSGALGASIKVGEFTRLGKRLTLRIEESRAGGRDLIGIFAQATEKNGGRIAVSAERGTFLATDDPDLILFRLYNGVLVHKAVLKGTAPRVLRFAQHDLPVDLPKISNFRARGEKELELTLPELVITQNDPTKARSIQLQAEANFHRRLIQVCVLFVIPFLGIAVAIPPKRSSAALGVFVGLASLIIYNEISEFAEDLGARGKVPVLIVQWVAFSLFSLHSLWLFYRAAFRVGDPPIAGLSRMSYKIWKLVVTVVRINRRRLRAHSSA